MSPNLTISRAMRAAQRRAVDPAASAWVTSNAGSGKTHVLTARVLRLLLAGVRPDRLLCLTYTRAAAAEMRMRVARQLSEWTLMTDRQLASALSELAGEPPDEDRMALARRLFAHALDTPGGLKINTIHAFCESVLHRFPLESGVPFDFTVVEEAERDAMIAHARRAVLVEGLDGDGDLADAVETLFAAATDSAIETALSAALGLGARLRLVLADSDRARANLRHALALGETDNVAAIEAEIVEGATIAPAEYAALAAHLDELGGAKNLAGKLAAAAAVEPAADAIMTAFLNKSGSRPAANNLTDSVRADAALAARIEIETLRVAALAEKRAAAAVYESSAALMTVLEAILHRYEAAKRARAVVDFDDLIARVQTLLGTSPHKWVAYRLDAAISHILVDESQDTNPEQWQIVRALADEFFAGEGVERADRTIFAVGDEKQSIFSFQGAEPHLFFDTGRELKARADAAAKRLDAVELKASFRALRPLLDGVDLVFADPRAHQGLERQPRETAHEAARREKGGFIELWPLVDRPEPLERGQDYRTTPRDERSAERRLAERIGAEIEAWIASGRRLSGTDRAVGPADIVILVQKRGALFHEIVAELKRRGLPNAGADKLSVTGHIAVKDLIVLGEFMLNPADDLALATILRSPLFSVGEVELEALCAGRGETSVWSALGRLAETERWAAEAYGALGAWRDRLDLDRPYDFFARILYAGGGLRQFHARLGPEVDDVIEEFLDMALAHERTDQPSLSGFLAEMRAVGHEIKRELSVPAGVVRVMTVHGAKGLEAPIVILADAASVPAGRQLHSPVIVRADRADPARRFLLLAPGTGAPPAVEALKREERAAEFEEYHRRLYVAMTRAGAELFVAGIRPGRAGAETSWYELIEAGLAGNSADIPDRIAGVAVKRYPADAEWPGSAKAAPRAAPTKTPDWLDAAAPRAIGRQILEPAAAGASLARAVGAAGEAAFARQKGIAMHALLQHLPALPPERRREGGLSALATYLPEHRQAHEDLLAQALAILEDAELAWVFGPGSRAEVPIVAEFDRSGTPVRLAGRLDRLVVDETVRIVDFKSDAAPPDSPEETPPDYLVQLGLYRLALGKIFPARSVEAAVLWTETGRLMQIEVAALTAATNRFTLA